MFTEQVRSYETPPQLNLATDKLLGQTISYPLPSDLPIEEVLVHVGVIVGTAMTPTLLTTATTPEMLDGLPGILDQVVLTVNEPDFKDRPSGPRTVVNCSGMGLLEANPLNGLACDQSTQLLMNMAGIQYPGGSAANPTIATGAYQLTYRIPMVFEAIGEKLRSFCYLPAHLHKQPPVLTLSFATGATIMGGASYSSHITGIFVDIEVVRRVPTATSEKFIAENGGYLYYDFLESSYALPLGSAADFKCELPLPGQYTSLVCRQYLGGSVVTRNVIDNSGIGDATARGFGAETEWQLRIGESTKRRFKWKHLRQSNDFSRVLPASNSLITPSSGTATAFNAQSAPGGQILPSTNFRAAAVTKLDFLNDGLCGDTGNELGSLLDCDTPNQANAKVFLIGKPASVATNASYMFIVGHRFVGNAGGNDLSRFQRFFI